MSKDVISVRGARMHNLKNIDVDIPRNELVVVTGLSGSGKSSLAFDTLYAEGQRRYVESLSAYARQFLGVMQKPDVDSIENISPAIAIDQRKGPHNPRSTVGTITEIHDYLRLLYARAGTPRCPECGKEVARQTVGQIVDKILGLPEGTDILVLGPVIRGRKGEHRRVLEEIEQGGFVRVRIDGEVMRLEAAREMDIDENKRHDIEAVVDRLRLDGNIERSRVSDSVETALKLGAGRMIVHKREEDSDELFSEYFACEECGTSLPDLEPRLFSFNSPYGACPACDGLGEKVIRNPDTRRPRRYQRPEERYVVDRECEVCEGRRLRPEALAVTVADKNIAGVEELPLSETYTFLSQLQEAAWDEERAQVAAPILREIVSRLRFLIDVGLSYLTLSRKAGTLSGGEEERIRLATQIGSQLSGVLYILDEPSIGLHARDQDRLVNTLKRLRDAGNTVLVVEHDPLTIASADRVIDIGPGAGKHGGEVVFRGTPKQLERSGSLTGKYLSGRERVTLEDAATAPPDTGGHLVVKGATEHNLKDIDVSVPLGRLVCVTGVSGSGKSTLVSDILARSLRRTFYNSRAAPGEHDEIEGVELLDKAVVVDQSPIGRTPRSNPATYTGAFSYIRELFSKTREARARGYKPGRFSFNVKGGRCETCEGQGTRTVEMHFLPDIHVECQECKGTRYNEETLEITYHGKTIAEVLDMTVEEASYFFRNIPPLQQRLSVLAKVGLDYLELGQPATSLSGGEAQRIKLAAELAKTATGSTLYILDEPTTGLHFADVQKLLRVLRELVNRGNTVLVIEHEMNVIKNADWLIDLGPEGGEDGGTVVAEGSPGQVAQNGESHTGRYLKEALKQS